MRHKFAVFYILITLLCFTTCCIFLFHALGYRINRSASLPYHIYRITPLSEGEPIKRGDCMVIDLGRLANPVIDLGVDRGYVTRGEPMLKRIGAVPGDTVILETNSLTVNGRASALTVVSRDSVGGELSAWPTPLVLQPDFYWLTSDPERGFDSRYFGPLSRCAFTHRARPVF